MAIRRLLFSNLLGSQVAVYLSIVHIRHLMCLACHQHGPTFATTLCKRSSTGSCSVSSSGRSSLLLCDSVKLAAQLVTFQRCAEESTHPSDRALH
jgi:hypothetical protein